MPELPDVEVFTHYFKQKALRHSIQAVEIKRSKILKVSEKRFKNALIDEHFLSAKRRGKYLLAKISNGKYLVMHFGMTGFLYAYKDENPFKKHSQVIWEFKNHTHLAYVNIRLLGSISLTDSFEKFTQKLGPDALTISKSDFRALFKQGSVKSLLMDQKKLSGIGNIFSDEILFQMHLSPKRKVSSLSGQEIDRLYSNMKRVLKRAIQAKADPDRMPKTWLIQSRWKGVSCPKCKTPIRRSTMGGRSAYYCLNCQPN